MRRSRTISKLLFNAFRYRLLKLSGRPFRLEAISLEITHRCICRCQMCNIWRIPSSVADLPLSYWIELLSSPELHRLRELDITGGEPFLRNDLEELLRWICRAKPEHFPELKTLAITTNGLLTDRVLEVVGDVVGPLKEQGIDLVLACGMDAVGVVHDDIRKVKGAWSKLKATLAGLETLRESHPNLIVGIKTTIVPANVDQLELIVAYAREHDLFTIISPRIITANRFGNLDLQDNLQFSSEDRQTLRRFYASPAFAWNGHRQTLLDFLDRGAVHKPCSAGFNTLFIRHTGEVFPCPLIPTGLGHISASGLSQLLASPQARQFRRQIGQFADCKVCTEPGLERIAWPFEGLSCLRQMLRMGFNDFSRMARHMGLDKYLE